MSAVARGDVERRARHHASRIGRVEKMWYARGRSHTMIVPGVGHDVYEARPTDVAAVIKDAALHASP